VLVCPAGISVAVPNSDGDSVLGAHDQRPLLGVIREGAAGGPQAVDEFGGLGGTDDLGDQAQGTFVAGEQDSQCR
jgi:hypothetical protein